jgi:hypothetical protein
VHSSGRTRPRAVRRTAVAVAALLLTGCAQNAPGVAAEVGGDTITDEQVDQLAEALCALSAGSAAQGTPPATGQQTRRQALQILLDNALAADIIDPASVDRQQVAAAQKQAAATSEALPERLRGTFDEAVEGFATAQLGLAALGRQSLLDQGTKNPDQQTSLTEGQRLMFEHAEDTGVSVDPRFGTLEDGQLKPSDGSLSVAVSNQAKASSAGDATTADLPANLGCNAG